MSERTCFPRNSVVGSIPQRWCESVTYLVLATCPERAGVGETEPRAFGLAGKCMQTAFATFLSIVPVLRRGAMGKPVGMFRVQIQVAPTAGDATLGVAGGVTDHAGSAERLR